MKKVPEKRILLLFFAYTQCVTCEERANQINHNLIELHNRRRPCKKLSFWSFSNTISSNQISFLPFWFLIFPISSDTKIYRSTKYSSPLGKVVSVITLHTSSSRSSYYILFCVLTVVYIPTCRKRTERSCEEWIATVSMNT